MVAFYVLRLCALYQSARELSKYFTMIYRFWKIRTRLWGIRSCNLINAFFCLSCVIHLSPFVRHSPVTFVTKYNLAECRWLVGSSAEWVRPLHVDCQRTTCSWHDHSSSWHNSWTLSIYFNSRKMLNGWVEDNYERMCPRKRYLTIVSGTPESPIVPESEGWETQGEVFFQGKCQSNENWVRLWVTLIGS